MTNCVNVTVAAGGTFPDDSTTVSMCFSTVSLNHTVLDMMSVSNVGSLAVGSVLKKKRQYNSQLRRRVDSKRISCTAWQTQNWKKQKGMNMLPQPPAQQQSIQEQVHRLACGPVTTNLGDTLGDDWLWHNTPGLGEGVAIWRSASPCRRSTRTGVPKSVLRCTYT